MDDLHTRKLRAEMEAAQKPDRKAEIEDLMRNAYERAPEIGRSAAEGFVEGVTGKSCTLLPSAPQMDQTAKRDAGKPRISLVPAEAVRAIARVRMYGVTKYADPQNWRRVEPIRYLDAALRHLLDAVEDLESRDEESGLYSVDHALTDLAFLSALMKKEE